MWNGVAHALRRERACVPDLCHGPQNGTTPLLHALDQGHSEVVAIHLTEILLTAGAAADTTDKVRGGLG